MRFLSRTDNSIFGQWWWTIDRKILASAFLLMIFGLALVVTGSPSVADRIGADSSYFIVHHILYLI